MVAAPLIFIFLITKLVQWASYSNYAPYSSYAPKPYKQKITPQTILQKFMSDSDKVFEAKWVPRGLRKDLYSVVNLLTLVNEFYHKKKLNTEQEFIFNNLLTNDLDKTLKVYKDNPNTKLSRTVHSNTQKQLMIIENTLDSISKEVNKQIESDSNEHTIYLANKLRYYQPDTSGLSLSGGKSR